MGGDLGESVRYARPQSDSRGTHPKRSAPGMLNRRRQFGIRALLLLPLFVALALVVSFPKVITGDFCQLTIEEIRRDGDAITVVARSRISSSTGIGVTALRMGSST